MSARAATESAPGAPYMVPAVVGAVAVLDALAARTGSGATVSEVARATGRSKSTCHNLLSTLTALGLVERESDATRYRLGPGLVPLGAAAAREARPLALATERARQLAAEQRLSVALVQPTPDGRAGQVIAAVTPPQGLHVGITVGDRYGVADGAVGKILLACLPASERADALAGAVVLARTPRTVTDRAALLAEAREVGVRGWATSLGEFNENNAVAGAILGPRGRLALVCVVLGFPSQLPEDRIGAIGEELRWMCEAVSARIGGEQRQEGAA